MNKQDYLDWAEDYRRQADILEEKIKRCKEVLDDRQCSIWERNNAEKRLSELADMQLDCKCTMRVLLKRAEKIE